MLIACREDVTVPGRQTLTEASRDVEPGIFRCPSCHLPVTLKCGTVRDSYFAHASGSDCHNAGESARHIAAKAFLTRELRARGNAVTLEEEHPRFNRRIDVAATLPASLAGASSRVAIEVQDSPISVEEIKRRAAVDRCIGYSDTLWVFTENRLKAALGKLPGTEARLPRELMWVGYRRIQRITVLDTRTKTLLGIAPCRRSRDLHDTDGPLVAHCGPPKTIVEPDIVRLEPSLEFVLGQRIGLDRPPTLARFTADRTAIRPWRLEWVRLHPDGARTVEWSRALPAPPAHEQRQRLGRLWFRSQDSFRALLLTDPNTRRTWHLVFRRATTSWDWDPTVYR